MERAYDVQKMSWTSSKRCMYDSITLCAQSVEAEDKCLAMLSFLSKYSGLEKQDWNL